MRRFLTVSGELLLTAGFVLGLFLAWYSVVNDWVQSASQQAAAEEFAQDLRAGSSDESNQDSLDNEGTSVPIGTMPVVSAGEEGAAFALLYVPRFGDEYVRTIAEGIDLGLVLNDPQLGIGRYPSSAELGEPGNFSIAGHRTTYGAAFAQIAELRTGDMLYIEVEEGWYAYSFRNLEYVWPTDVDVLNPVPRQTVDVPRSHFLTLTSCHPRFSEAERIVAYAVLDAWYPRQSGPPEGIAALVAGAA